MTGETSADADAGHGATLADELVVQARRHQAMLDAFQDGWFVTAHDGSVVDANDEFCRIVGFDREHVVGAMPPYPWWSSVPADRIEVQRARAQIIATGKGEFDNLEIRRGDGEQRTITLSIAAIRDSSGRGERFGTIKDVTERVRAQTERDALLANLAEERDRVVRVQATTAALATAATRDDVTEAVLAHGMRAFGARAAVVMLVDEAQRVLVLAGLYGYRRGMFSDLQRVSLDSPSPLAVAVRARRRLEFRDLRDYVDLRPELSVVMQEIGSAGVCVPMLLQDRAVGSLGIAFGDETALSDDALADLENLASLAGQAYDRVRLSELDREIAHVLQHSLLLDVLPETRDAELSARYVSSVAEMEVGGDWYDVIDLGAGRLGLAVGDVVGRGVRAATTMGQLRSALRALALAHDDPGVVLSHLDHFARVTAGAAMATVVYAVYDPTTAGLRYACAGHPPPLLAGPHGVRFLDEGRSVPVGAGIAAERETATATLAGDDMLVLYTDGLIERRGEAIDIGLARLAATLEARLAADAPKGPVASVDDLSADLLEELVGDSATDDVALLVVRSTVRSGAPFHRRVPAEAVQLGSVRRELQRWMTREGIPAAVASEILLAVGEAAANVVEHAYAPAPARGDVEVEARSDGELVEVTVRDRGTWKRPRRDTRRGRGHALMEALMDDVDYTTTSFGTTVTMRRRAFSATAAIDPELRSSLRP